MNGSFVGWSSPTANEEMHDASVVQQLARQKLIVIPYECYILRNNARIEKSAKNPSTKNTDIGKKDLQIEI